MNEDDNFGIYYRNQQDFEEFLLASGVSSSVIQYLRECFESLSNVSESIHKTILRKFKEYLICRGLPDAVKEFMNDKHFSFNTFRHAYAEWSLKQDVKTRLNAADNMLHSRLTHLRY